jgi:hypothetical protein
VETVRDILAAHRSGISKPGLMAWARLRVDPEMTDAQLDDELARLGDEVVDVQGFLYLRSYVEPSRRPAARTEEKPDWSRLEPAGRTGCGIGGVWRLVGVGVFLWWLLGFVGGFLEEDVDLFPDATPEPTATPIASPSATPPVASTPSIGEVVPWREIAVGDCIIVPREATVGELRRVPCDTRHGGEVFALVDHPGPLSAFPDDGFAAFVAERCAPAFEAWTGAGLEEQDLLRIQWFSPTWVGWVEGDRQVTCYLVQADGANMYSSYRTRP